MTEIKRVYRQSLPAMKLVGRRYGEGDRQNGTFSHKWSEWFQNGLFEPLRLPGGEEPFEDCDAFIGLCRCKEGEPFEYWIGVFVPESFAVPEGYESVSFPARDVAVCWVSGKEPDIYSYCCLERLHAEGFEWTADADGVKWCFERYVCPRFTEPDGEGNAILDMCFSVDPK